jgi:small subunit ribosomal protein S17
MVTQETNKNKITTPNKVIVGTVVSDKMSKTIVVEVTRTLKDPFWGKVIRRHKKFKAHDENKIAKMGDVVEIKECRPLSKEKHMTLVRVLKKIN